MLKRENEIQEKLGRIKRLEEDINKIETERFMNYLDMILGRKVYEYLLAIKENNPFANKLVKEIYNISKDEDCNIEFIAIDNECNNIMEHIDENEVMAVINEVDNMELVTTKKFKTKISKKIQSFFKAKKKNYILIKKPLKSIRFKKESKKIIDKITKNPQVAEELLHWKKQDFPIAYEMNNSAVSTEALVQKDSLSSDVNKLPFGYIKMIDIEDKKLYKYNASDIQFYAKTDKLVKKTFRLKDYVEYYEKRYKSLEDNNNSKVLINKK